MSECVSVCVWVCESITTSKSWCDETLMHSLSSLSPYLSSLFLSDKEEPWTWFLIQLVLVQLFQWLINCCLYQLVGLFRIEHDHTDTRWITKEGRTMERGRFLGALLHIPGIPREEFYLFKWYNREGSSGSEGNMPMELWEFGRNDRNWHPEVRVSRRILPLTLPPLILNPSFPTSFPLLLVRSKIFLTAPARFW